jgi:hypothetical protein
VVAIVAFGVVLVASASMHRARYLLAGQTVVLALAVLAAGCGSDKDKGAAASSSTTTTVATQNACPTSGCSVTITDVKKEGTELRVSWTANYAPDFSKNHIHVYWSKYSADQVSDDAAKRKVVQGEWEPTDSYPTYLTEGAVSTKVRADSPKICVTAGDRDHIVIDSSIVNCRDVSDLF